VRHRRPSCFTASRKPGATALAAAVSAFLRHVQALPWDSEAAARYGTLRAQLEAAGTPVGNLDTLIAAHALAVGATLVTHDRAFRQVPGLVVEDWIEP
jgi:tRNA(fMet)-specific endonuclease VapC